MNPALNDKNQNQEPVYGFIKPDDVYKYTPESSFVFRFSNVMVGRNFNMQIYIATKFENKDAFQTLKKTLELDGHKITHDWTGETPNDRQGPELYAYLQKCAKKDIEGVIGADVLIFLPVTKDTPMAGAYVELGAALSTQGRVYRRRIIAVDAFNPSYQRNIFWHLPEIEHVKTVEEAVGLLKP